jgi:hypothetical protein
LASAKSGEVMKQDIVTWQEDEQSAANHCKILVITLVKVITLHSLWETVINTQGFL